MWPAIIANALRRVINPLGRALAIYGGICLLLSAIVVGADILLRLLVDKSLGSSMEYLSILLSMTLLSGLTYTELRKRHISIDILVKRFRPNIQRIVIASGQLLSLLVVTILSWRVFLLAIDFLQRHSVTDVQRIPWWPFIMVLAFEFFIFIFAIAINFFDSLAELLQEKGKKSYLFLLPAVAVIGFLVLPLAGVGLTSVLSPQMIGLVGMLIVFALIFLKVPIGAVFAIVTMWGIAQLASPAGALVSLSNTIKSISVQYTWAVVPMFTLVGMVVSVGAISRDLYDFAYKWIGHTAGGLASATTFACALFAAVVGDSTSGLVTMSSVALPEMRRYKYNDRMATASIAISSTLGILIPPSIPLIIYGFLTYTSIGRLFMAGIFPGIMLALIYMALIFVRSKLNPSLGPPGPAFSLREKISSIRGIWAAGILIILVLGGIYTGIFTPTEAGAVAVIGAIFITLARRKLTLSNFNDSLMMAIEFVAILFFIFIFAMNLSFFLTLSNLPAALANWVGNSNLSPYGIIALILLIYMFLGCIMNVLPAIIMTLPIFFPMVMEAGFDPVWFGILVCVMLEMGVITPPIGLNVFLMSSLSNVPIYSIFRGIFPFWIAMCIGVALLVAFPQISLWLPNMMFGG